MMMALFEQLQATNMKTALLEAFDWDESRLDLFMGELEIMLLAAPPNVDKALFWIRETPWTSFDNDRLPRDVYDILYHAIRQQEKIFLHRVEESRVTKLPYDGEWN